MGGTLVPLASVLELLNHPGHSSQKSHGRRGGSDFDERAAGAITGREALESVAYETSDRAIDSALGAYGGSTQTGGVREINGGLRGGREMTPAARANIASIDRAMREGPVVQRDTLVYRAVRGEGPFGVSAEKLQGSDLTGLTWRDDAFVSTGVDNWAGNGTMMRILVPPGTRALSYTKRLDDDEIVLDRGLTFRVVADHGPKEGSRTVKILDVEIVPS